MVQKLYLQNFKKFKDLCERKWLSGGDSSRCVGNITTLQSVFMEQSLRIVCESYTGNYCCSLSSCLDFSLNNPTKNCWIFALFACRSYITFPLLSYSVSRSCQEYIYACTIQFGFVYLDLYTHKALQVISHKRLLLGLPYLPFDFYSCYYFVVLFLLLLLVILLLLYYYSPL